jgi:hypothetical protein
MGWFALIIFLGGQGGATSTLFSTKELCEAALKDIREQTGTSYTIRGGCYRTQ